MKERIFITVFIIFSLNNFIWSDDNDIFDSYRVSRYNRNNYSKAQPIINKAEKEYNNGNIKESIKLYKEALQYAANPEWYYILGNMLFDVKDYKTSEKSYYTAGVLNYERKDLAYYNAACAASMNKDEYNSIDNFKKALISGYDYWSHILKDPDIEYLRNLDEFPKIKKEYQLPLMINNIDEDLKKIVGNKYEYIKTDVDGDDINELIILFYVYDLNDPIGAYYFALYKIENGQWKYINKTASDLHSTPSDYRNNLGSLDENIEYNLKPPFLSVDLDNIAGNEIIVLSSGLTYYAGKILIYKKNKLIELTEIEGFENIHKIDGEMNIIGHQVTDGAFEDGTSEEYNTYILKDNKIVIKELNKKSITLLTENKIRIFNQKPEVFELSSLFWFLYNHNRGELSEKWIDKYSKQLNEGEYKERFVNFMREKIK